MGLYGDDAAVLCPYLGEQGEQELAPLGWVGLQFPEAGKRSRRSRARSGGWVGWWAEALGLFFECLAAHDVSRFGEVAEDVEVLQALELVEEFASALAGRRLVLGVGGFQRAQEQVKQFVLWLEVGYPGDELCLQLVGLDDTLAQACP